MTIATKYAATLAQEDPAVLLRAIQSQGGLDKVITAANAEMDEAGPVGLTVTFKQIRVNTSSEGLLGKLFGKLGSIYVVTTALDGSGKPFEYKTQFFEGIARGDRLPLGDGGLLVSSRTDPRWFIDLHMVVMESDSGQRELGAAIDEARRQIKLDDVVARVSAVVPGDLSVVSDVVTAVDAFAATLAQLLKKNGDDHVATVHDFYLKPQAFGQGRHPARGLKTFQKVAVAYQIDLTQL